MRSEKEKMLAGELYRAGDAELQALALAGQALDGRIQRHVGRAGG
ncbi:maltose acetyltransferase domain-containing protein [Limimaricola litoreus]|nr:maltose acetyltransferase domain-containing protein [Limimaricola litoreus]